uniref:RING-type domain-containing protein n=1 Tax=Attheya septentrionalis TaxID=420275 RepID=A0A7S2XL52_9STRA|mmetsp:Transcript_16119/g.29322  ORF Transcript_16119/g.29322 Transcript_16119/m.29322 type:complete len:424 (+) Transcript_16119:177-1448(+)
MMHIGKLQTKPRPDELMKNIREDDTPMKIFPRTLLPWSVHQDDISRGWVATISTLIKRKQSILKKNGQKAKSGGKLQMPFDGALQAREYARSKSPPLMRPFDEWESCFTCEKTFSTSRRACHCRNCGVCICISCCTRWSSSRIPDTYNFKDEATVHVCSSCDWLSTSFYEALSKGCLESVAYLYASGNLNLRSYLIASTNDTMLPVHLAARSGNLDLLRWLVDVHACPITGNLQGYGQFMDPSLTTKSRTVLDIALRKKHLEIVSYLVINKGMALDQAVAEKKSLLGVLHTALQRLEIHKNPDYVEETHDGAVEVISQKDSPNHRILKGGSQITKISRVAHFEAMASSLMQTPLQVKSSSDMDDDASECDTIANDHCIICVDAPIACVLVPCGHQICCENCATKLSVCPICTKDCKALKTFHA